MALLGFQVETLGSRGNHAQWLRLMEGGRHAVLHVLPTSKGCRQGLGLRVKWPSVITDTGLHNPKLHPQALLESPAAGSVEACRSASPE